MRLQIKGLISSTMMWLALMLFVLSRVQGQSCEPLVPGQLTCQDRIQCCYDRKYDEGSMDEWKIGDYCIEKVCTIEGCDCYKS